MCDNADLRPCRHCLLFVCKCTQRNEVAQLKPDAVFELERNGQFDPGGRTQTCKAGLMEAPVPAPVPAKNGADAKHAVAVDSSNKGRLEKWYSHTGGDVVLAAKLSGVTQSSAKDYLCERLSSVSLETTFPPASRVSSLRRAKGYIFGCECVQGGCRTPDCPCFKANTECDPNWCTRCGVCSSAGCGNDALRMKRHLDLEVKQSTTGPAGNWGLFLAENAKKGQLVTEYVGEVLTDSEIRKRDDDYKKNGIL